MKNKKTIRLQRGQSLVELAISLTVILMLLSGAVDFGMALFSYVAIRDAAQEGALYASINGAPDGVLTSTLISNIQARVKGTSTNPVNLSTLPANQIVVTLTNTGNTYCQGLTNGTANGVTVTVSYNYPIIMPLLGTIIGSQTIPLQAAVTDTILHPNCP
jgi:Flp pilus assembly protein TadG